MTSIDSLIRHLNQAISITDLCLFYNIELEENGKKMMGYCPFHEDDTLSLIIIPYKNLWMCRQSCHSELGGSDNIHFIMKIENLNFEDAVEKLSCWKLLHLRDQYKKGHLKFKHYSLITI